MKAVVYSRYGDPAELTLTEIEKPTPKEDDVLIKVFASSINSWDWDLLRGKPFLVRMLFGFFNPNNKILGADVAGVVEAIGRNVNYFKPGDEVFGDIASAGFGGLADYVSVPEKLLAKKSPKMSFEQAAALPQAGLLALQGLRYKRPVQQGQQLLINGAGGGVGTFALQYAKSIGAEVTCVDREEKFDVLRSLGADHLIDYRKEDYTRTGRQYDYILDVIAHRTIKVYKRALKPGGIFAMVGGSMGGLLFNMMLLQPLLSKFRSKQLGIMGYRVSRNDLNELKSLFEEGKLTPVVDKCFPLSAAVEAFSYFGLGKFKGKIIITVNK